MKHKIPKFPNAYYEKNYVFQLFGQNGSAVEKTMPSGYCFLSSNRRA